MTVRLLLRRVPRFAVSPTRDQLRWDFFCLLWFEGRHWDSPANRASHVPLTVLYSSFTKLFLLLLLSIWQSSTLPSSHVPNSDTPAHVLRSSLPAFLDNHALVRVLLEAFDDDNLDREWVVRNLIGGMAAGFGLRGEFGSWNILPTKPCVWKSTYVQWFSTVRQSSRQLLLYLGGRSRRALRILWALGWTLIMRPTNDGLSTRFLSSEPSQINFCAGSLLSSDHNGNWTMRYSRSIFAIIQAVPYSTLSYLWYPWKVIIATNLIDDESDSDLADMSEILFMTQISSDQRLRWIRWG